ncbi:MAG: trimethylamine methyltransferase family protein [Thermodesulfobacteriota bacterium]
MCQVKESDIADPCRMSPGHRERSVRVLGEDTVSMLLQVHQDALWILENLGVGVRQPDIVDAFRPYEESGLAIFYEDRIYPAPALVNRSLATVPGLDRFFVPEQSLFIGGTAPYVYDDEKGEGGILPRPEHAERIARFAQANEAVAGMGRGVKLKDETAQIALMDRLCEKPLYFAVTSRESLEAAIRVHEQRKNVMVVFCLTRPPLEVNENFSESFVQVVRAGLPVFISAMPMAGLSAPFCVNGVLAMTHAEVLFGIIAAQLLNPGITCIHAGFPTIADPRIEYNANYGLVSHNLTNILMAHLNMMLDLPTCQSGGTTNEEHLTKKAYDDARAGQAMFKKYGVHMIRHPFSFLRYLIDFSMEKMERAARLYEEVREEDAPEIEMPVYDPRGMESIRNIGLASYMDDPLTTANLGRVFVS